MMGNWMKVDELDDCDPIKTNKDTGFNKSIVKGAPDLLDDDPAYPCGLVAKSLFNDTFSLTPIDDGGNTNSVPIEINDDNIAWESDREYKFKNLEGDLKQKQWTDVEDRKLTGFNHTPNYVNQLTHLPHFIFFV